MRLRPMPLQWEPMRVGDPLDDELALRALRRELESWEGTPYMAGQQRKGEGVDCVRFVCAVLDFLGGTSTPLPSLPPDTALHSRATAIAAMLRMRRLFEPVEEPGRSVQPGDLVVVGPRDGGPGHALIVGCRPWELWEAGTAVVQRVGWSIPERSSLFATYRKVGRLPWATR